MSIAQRETLGELASLAEADLTSLYNLALSSPNPAGVLVDAYPELASSYTMAAADLAATMYEDSAPDLTFNAVPADPGTTEQYQANARWALSTGVTSAMALILLFGSLERALYNGARQTMIDNANAEGGLWARYASATACEFCRMLATRGDVYASKAGATRVGAGKARPRGSQRAGDLFHDNCKCIAVQVRPGQTYHAPAYVAQWEAEYQAAFAAARGGTTKDVLKNMRTLNPRPPRSR